MVKLHISFYRHWGEIYLIITPATQACDLRIISSFSEKFAWHTSSIRHSGEISLIYLDFAWSISYKSYSWIALINLLILFSCKYCFWKKEKEEGYETLEFTILVWSELTWAFHASKRRKTERDREKIKTFESLNQNNKTKRWVK